MRAATNTVFATLMATLLLVNPLGACPDFAKAPAAAAAPASSHPCCPVNHTPAQPAQEDCSRPNCICMDTRSVPALLASSEGPTVLLSTLPPGGPAITVPIFLPVQPAPTPPRAAARHLFVTLHQLLI